MSPDPAYESRHDRAGPGQEPGELFRRDLRELYRREDEIPESVDRAVLEAARARLSRRRNPWPARLGRVGVAAALVVVAVLAWQHFNPPGESGSQRGRELADSTAGSSDGATFSRVAPPATGETSAESALGPQRPGYTRRFDIDGDGQVDVVDALELARRLEQRQVARADWDFNGDGRLDRGDAEHIARSVVTLY